MSARRIFSLILVALVFVNFSIASAQIFDVSLALDSPSGNLPQGATSAPILRVKLTALGDDFQYSSSMVVASSSMNGMDNVKAYLGSTQVGETSDIDPTNDDAEFNYGASVIVRDGTFITLVFIGDLRTPAGVNYQPGTVVRLSLAAGTFNAVGLKTGKLVSTPSVIGRPLTVLGSKLTVVKNLAVPDAGPANPNGVIGKQEMLIGSLVITAGAGEGSDIPVITMRDTLGTAAEVFQNLRLESGGPADTSGNYSAGTRIGITVGTLTQGPTSYDFRPNPAISLDANRQLVVNIYADGLSSARAEQVARVNNTAVGVFTVQEVQGVGRQTGSSTSNAMTPGFDTLQRIYIAQSGVFRTGLDSTMAIKSNVLADSGYTGMGLYFSASVEDMAFCQPVFMVYAQDTLGNYINPLDVIGDIVFYTKHPDAVIREPLPAYVSNEIVGRPYGFMMGGSQLWRLVERGQTVFGGLDYKVRSSAKAGTRFWFVYYSEDVYKFDQEILTRPNIVVRGESSSYSIRPEQVPFRELIGPVITVVDSIAIPPPDSTSPPQPIFNFDGVIGPEELFRKPFDLKTESPAQGFEFTFFCPGADSLAWSESAEFITQTRLEGDTLRVVGVSAQGGYKLGELVVKYSAPGTYEIPWSVVLYLTGGTKVGQEGTLRVKVLAEPAVSVEPPVISVADSARVKLSPALGVLFGFGTDGISGELRNGWFVPSLESVRLYDWQGKTEARTTLRFATEFGVVTADLTLKALLGDVNIDNGVNVIDVVMMLRFILDDVYFVSYQQVVSDFDHSGSFDLWDVIALVRHILGLPQETHETLSPPVLTKSVAADLVGLISRLEAMPGVDQQAVVELKRLLGLGTGEGNVSVPTEFSLEQNYPNPFNPTTTIKFALPQSGHVVLKIYNMLGQEVIELVNAVLPAGFHEVIWNAAGTASGMYFYRLTANGGGVQTRKMALLK